MAAGRGARQAAGVETCPALLSVRLGVFSAYLCVWSLAFLFVVTASAVQKAQKRLKLLLRTPISSAFIVAYPKMWAF